MCRPRSGAWIFSRLDVCALQSDRVTIAALEREETEYEKRERELQLRLEQRRAESHKMVEAIVQEVMERQGLSPQMHCASRASHSRHAHSQMPPLSARPTLMTMT